MKIGLILNYRNYRQTIACCRNLIKAGLDRIVVVDNGSPNESLAKLKSSLGNDAKVSILGTKANLGYARGNNFGLQAIEKKFGLADDHLLYIVNPDSVPDATVIKQISAFCWSHPDAGTMTVIQEGNPKMAWHNLTKTRAMLYNSRIFSKLAYRLGHHEEVVPYHVAGQRTASIKVDVNTGAFFPIRQTVMAKVGYFDTATFLYYEEQALSFKLQAQGFQNYLLTTSTYRHEGQGSTHLATRAMLGYYQQSRRYLLKQYLHAGPLALRFYDWTIKLEDILAGDRSKT